MSDLLKLSDFDAPEFIDRIAGLFRHCQSLFQRAGIIAAQTEARISGIRKNTFEGLAEIGEAFLRVQDARPGEFDAWFELHRERFGFSLSHANRCKAAARLVREYGLDRAYEISLSRLSSAPIPILADTFRLTKPVEMLTPDERSKWLERLRPWAETYHELERLDSA